jgi:copper homeostasis protein CutC
VGSGSGAPVDRKTLRRLEEKVDNLRTTIDQLVRMQVDMQEAMVRMQQQEMTKGLTQGQGAKLEKKNDKAS